MEPIDLNDPKRHKVIKGAPSDRGMAQDAPGPEVADEEQDK